MTLSINQIQSWLKIHQKRMQCDEHIPSMTNIADRAGISRQTLYAILNGERTEFGQSAQIRLSRVISQISSEYEYQHSNLARIDFSGQIPRIRFLSSVICS